MRSDAGWRVRLLSGARHAAAAAGLGITWLLLSGAGAHAASPVGDLLGGAIAPPPAAASSPATPTTAASTSLASTPLPSTDGLVGTVARTTALPATVPAGTVADLAGTATASVASTVQRVPAVSPVLAGVAGTASEVVGTIGVAAVGLSHGVGDVLAPVTAPVVAVLQPAAGPSGGVAAPAPAAGTQPQDPAAASPTPAPGPMPAAVATAPTTLDRTASSALPAARAVAAIFGFESAITGVPSLSLPGLPAAPAAPLLPPPAAPSALEGQFSGQGGGAGLSVLGTGAFGLVLLAGRGALRCPVTDRLPASPAFDPGSTPD